MARTALKIDTEWSTCLCQTGVLRTRTERSREFSLCQRACLMVLVCKQLATQIPFATLCWLQYHAGIAGLWPQYCKISMQIFRIQGEKYVLVTCHRLQWDLRLADIKFACAEGPRSFGKVVSTDPMNKHSHHQYLSTAVPRQSRKKPTKCNTGHIILVTEKHKLLVQWFPTWQLQTLGIMSWYSGGRRTHCLP